MPVVPSVLQGQLGLKDTSWRDRLKPAAYKSPKGTRITFDYEEVSRETDKRTAPFEFSGINDAYVQDNGHGARRYPMRCFFWGKHCDRVATAFEAALLESGPGVLEHPLYGTFNAIPFGTITRRDDLKNAANQSVVEVVFWTTTLAVYPGAQKNARSEIAAALDGFDVVAAQQFADATDLRGAIAKANIKNTIKDFLKKVSGAMQAASNATSEVNRQFRDIERQINSGMNVLVGQPLRLAQQCINLVQAPGRALIAISTRLDGYRSLALSIFSSAAAAGTQLIPGIPGTSIGLASVKLKESNDFHTSDLFLMSSVAGSALSVLENEFSTRPEALAAAESVVNLLAEVVLWRDQRFENLEQSDPGGSIQALERVVALVAGQLVQASFTLKTERRLVLDRPRTIIDLCAELYGNVDDAQLDLLINSNNLTGVEILELPRGKSVAFYT